MVSDHVLSKRISSCTRLAANGAIHSRMNYMICFYVNSQILLSLRSVETISTLELICTVCHDF